MPNGTGASFFQTFWQLDGEQGEMLWFYHYMDKSNPWLLAQPKKGKGDSVVMFVPTAPEEQWHYWAVSWRKGGGAYIYLDGKLVGQSPCQSPTPIKSITIGQASNPYSPPAQDKIIDEFKIYDAALDSGAIAQHYWQEGDFSLQPRQTVVPTQRKIAVDGKIGAEEWKDASGITGFIDQKNWSLATQQTWAKLTYDSQNLYLAMHSASRPKGDKDKLFFQIKSDSAKGKLYRFNIDSKGTISGPKSSARVQSVVSGTGWTIEAAIPLKSLGVHQLTDGTIWHLNMGRILGQNTSLWAAGRRVDDKNAAVESGSGTISFSKRVAAVTDLRQFRIAPNGQVSATLNLFNPNSTMSELNVELKVANKTLQQKVSLSPGQRRTLTLNAIPKNADASVVELAVKHAEKVLFRHAAPLILKRVGQLTMWSYPSLHQVRLGWELQSAPDSAALNLKTQLKNAGGKIVRTASVPHLRSSNGSTVIDVKALEAGKYLLETQILDGNNLLQQESITFDKKPLPSWLGNTLGVSDTPPSPWTDVTVAREKDTVSIWGRTYDYAGRLLPAQIINQGKAMLAAPMKLIVREVNTTPQSSGANQAKTSWTKTTAARADSQRAQTLGAVDVKSESYIEYDGMTWVNLTVKPNNNRASLNGLTLEIPFKAEWAELIKPSDDYKMEHTGALPEKGWKGKASSMPWIGNGDGGFQFFQETTATWVGSKSIEIVPDGQGSVVLRVHLVDAPVTLDKPLDFAFGWITSPVKAAPKNHRDWMILSPSNIVDDPEGKGVTANYVRQAAAINPGLKPYFLWWQGWWWLPEAFEGNPDESGLVPVPADGNTPLKNAVREYYGTKFYGAPYGRLTQIGTANPWFEQFGDEWVRSTSKFTPNTSIPAARQITTVSQASSSLRDLYAWGYNRLFEEGDVRALYFDESHPIFDDNIHRGAGTVHPDGSVEPTRNILGTRRTMQRIYTLLKAKHPDAQIFIHMSGEIIIPVDSFADGLIDGENYYWLLDRTNNRGYEKVLSVDQFRTEYSTQNNFGPASIFLPQIQSVDAVKADEWEALGYQHADYILGLNFLHDSNMWWAYLPFEYLAKVNSAFTATGRNSQWSFTPYWRQQDIALPKGVYASFYQSPDSRKMLMVIMNTSGKDQEINVPLALGKNTFKTANAVYPSQSLNTQGGEIRTLRIENNNFSSVLLEQ